MRKLSLPFSTMSQIAQRGDHLRTSEDRRPLPEHQTGYDNDRDPLIELADQMEPQLIAGLWTWQVTEFVQNDEVVQHEIRCKAGRPS